MGRDQDVVTRRELQYENHAERFKIPSGKVNQQYSQVYFNRLNQMRPGVKAAAEKRWGSATNVPIVERLVNIGKESECIAIGLIFKEMKLKPSILTEYSKDGGDMMPNPPKRTEKLYADEGDAVVFEDETGRIDLDLSKASLTAEMKDLMVSGIVIALRGSKTNKGVFAVSDACPVTMLPQKNTSIPDEDVYVCIISGLAFGDETVNPLRAELLLETLRGSSLSSATQNAKLAHVIVAGNSVCRAKESMDKGEYLKSHKPLNRDQQTKAALPMRELDRFLCSVASAMPVDVMPGENDPVNYMMPQQSLHPCLLPDSTKFETFHRATNPWDFALGGNTFLGTSGQNVDDFMRYLQLPEGSSDSKTRRLDVMEAMLRFGHIAPTAPDTLSSFPFIMGDPFVLKEWPNIFFAGNQPHFATRLIQEGDAKARIISVPSFSNSGEVVLVNIRTLEPHTMYIDIAI